jgi:hypothetical protein
VRLALSIGLLAALALAPAAASGVFVDRSVKAFRSGDHVYVDPGARATLPPKLQAFLLSHIRRTGGPLFYAAVLPPFAAREAGGPLHLVADSIGRRLGCTCTVAVVVGNRYAALSSALPRGKGRELLALAVAKHRKDGVLAVLEDLDDRVAAEIDNEGSNSLAARALGIGLAVLVATVLLFVVVRRRRQWRELGRMRGEAEAELAELGAHLAERPAAREAYERAEEELALARKPADLERVQRALAEVRRLTPG